MSRFEHLRGVEVVDGTWSWDADRAMLYAVGVGAGLDDPLTELQFTTENTPGHPQQVIPTFATLMNLPGPWLDLLGIETEAGWTVGTVHGEQAVTLNQPIPPSGTARVRKVIEGLRQGQRRARGVRYRIDAGGRRAARVNADEPVRTRYRRLRRAALAGGRRAVGAPRARARCSGLDGDGAQPVLDL
jgi:hypothetical protein